MIHFPEQVHRLRENAFNYCAYPRFLHRSSEVIILYWDRYCKGRTLALQDKQWSVGLSYDAVF